MEAYAGIERNRLVRRLLRAHVLHGLTEYEARDPRAPASKYLSWTNYRDEAEAALDEWLAVGRVSPGPLLAGLAEDYVLAWQDDLWNLCMGRRPGPRPAIGERVRLADAPADAPRTPPPTDRVCSDPVVHGAGHPPVPGHRRALRRPA